MNRIIKEDIEKIIELPIEWEKLRNKTVLVTGATGMVGQYLVFTLLQLNKSLNCNIKILGLCRNQNKGSILFREFIEKELMSLIVQDVSDELQLNDCVDYIFHTASPANPVFYSSDPVGTIMANTIGTKNTIELAKKYNAVYCYISTMEVYGQMNNSEGIKENDFGAINTLESRSCYPESKRLGENLCIAYHEQYGVDVRIIRPAYTYGPGMSINDSRVQCEFMRKVINDENIVMKSDGSMRRTYTYVADVISGIFFAVINGNEIVYNVANENAVISIKGLAETIIAAKKNAVSNLVVQIQNEKGWSQVVPKIMSCERLKLEGWSPMYEIESGINRTMKYNMEKEFKNEQ